MPSYWRRLNCGYLFIRRAPPRNDNVGFLHFLRSCYWRFNLGLRSPSPWLAILNVGNSDCCRSDPRSSFGTA